MDFRKRELKVSVCQTHLRHTVLCPPSALMCSFVTTAESITAFFFPHWRSVLLGPCSQRPFVSRAIPFSWLTLPAWAHFQYWG